MGDKFAIVGDPGTAYLKSLLEYQNKRHAERGNEVLELTKIQARIEQCNLDLEHCERLIQLLLKNLSGPELLMDDSTHAKRGETWSKPFLASAVNSEDLHDLRDPDNGLTCPLSGGRPVISDHVGLLLHQAQHARLDNAGKKHRDANGFEASPTSLVGRVVSPHDELSETSGMIAVMISNERPCPAEQLQPVRFLSIDIVNGRKVPGEGSRDTGAELNVIAKKYAEYLGALIYPSAEPVLVAPWAGGDRPLGTRTHCWLPMEIPGRQILYWINFCVFDDEIMGNDQCIFSVKTCIKTSLILDGLMC